MSKRQIRRSCFETNSSSMHSLVITKDDRPYTQNELENGIYIDRNGELCIRDDELYFDRAPFELLTTFEAKLRYAIAIFCGGYANPGEKEDKKFLEIQELVKKYFPDLKEIKLDMDWQDVYVDDKGKEYLGSNVLKRDDSFFAWGREGFTIPVTPTGQEIGFNCYGCVDHQSYGLLQEFLKKKGISLEEFLTNKKYIVVIDGDEYFKWHEYKASGLIDLGNIVEEYPPNGHSYDFYKYEMENADEKTD